MQIVFAQITANTWNATVLRTNEIVATIEAIRVEVGHEEFDCIYRTTTQPNPFGKAEVTYELPTLDVARLYLLGLFESADPDVLEALISVTESLGHCALSGRVPPNTKSLLNARAAIAKARGEG